jgi:hypothetical protein
MRSEPTIAKPCPHQYESAYYGRPPPHEGMFSRNHPDQRPSAPPQLCLGGMERTSSAHASKTRQVQQTGRPEQSTLDCVLILRFLRAHNLHGYGNRREDRIAESAVKVCKGKSSRPPDAAPIRSFASPLSVISVYFGDLRITRPTPASRPLRALFVASS